MAFLPRSVRGRLLLLVLVETLPVFGAMTISYRHERRTAIEQYRHVAFTDTADLVTGYSQLATATERLLVSLAGIPQVRTADCGALLGGLIPAFPYLTNIGVATVDGTVVCTANPGARANIGGSPAFARALATGRFTVGDYELGPWSRRRVFPFFEPLTDSDGRLAAILFAGFDLSWAQRLKSNGSAEPAEILVVDNAGRIAHASTGRFGEDLSRDPLFARAEAERTGSVHGSFFGRPAELWTFARWGGEGRNRKYVFVAYSSEAAAVAAMRTVFLWNVGGVGLLTAALGLSVLFLGRLFLLKPIDELIARTQRVAAGDLTVRRSQWHQGEIARLATAIDTMTAALARQQQERDVAEAEAQRLAQIVRSSHEAIISGDRAGLITSWNRGAERIFGYSASEVLGRPVMRTIVPPDHRDEFTRSWERMLSGRTMELRETERVTKDGRRITVWITVSPELDQDGSVTGWSAILRDVTSLKRAEAALRESEHRLTQFLDVLPLPVYVVGLDGRATFVNEHARRLLAIGPGDSASFDLLEGPPFLVAGTNEPYPLSRRPIVRALSGESASAGDIELAVGDRRVPLEAWAAPVRDTAGAVRYAIVVYRDLTDQRTLEEQYRQAQKMEAIGRLAGGIAHDFNNLLTVIVGHAELLLEKATNGDRADLTEVKDAADRATTLTRQLLAFSRRQMLQPRTIALNDQLGGLLKILPRILGENIVVVTRLAPALATVSIDPGQFDQVVMNLAVNARDAMPEGGRLTIETANATIDADAARPGADVPAGRYVRFTMSDTGVGIDPQTRARIFEPFFTTKDRGKGTGLGLATVYGIVRQSGGHIVVDSEPGRGASFSLFLPASQSPATVEDAPSAPSPLGGRERILLVEDDPAVRSLVTQSLARYGYEVLVAEGPAAALGHLEREGNRIDLMLTDVVLKSLDGARLAAIVGELRPSLPVLYMSGYTDNPIVNRGIVDNKLPFLPKPFTPEQLARTVRALLDSRHAPSLA